ncbi:MAG: hypothetical protein HUU02_07805 [Bacteroidetes bacterium]|nr:hypothetical protein [Bacteroidota bacterium]
MMERWTTKELTVLKKLTTPHRIQEFLDRTGYSAESRYRCPHAVLHDRKAHCFDGAVFAAAMLRRIGYRPLIVDMQAVRDDDHVIAVFMKNRKYGAIAKSNFAGLRYREPLYRDVRELVMSYFESFYNSAREKTLRQFTAPLDLSRYPGFEFSEERMEEIGLKLSYLPVTKLMTPAEIRALLPVDDRSYKAGLLGANAAGLYKP